MKWNFFCDNETFFEHMLNILTGKRRWNNIFGLVLQGLSSDLNWWLGCCHFISRVFFLTTSWKNRPPRKKNCSLPERRNKQFNCHPNLKPKIFLEIIADIKKIIVLFYRFYLKKRKRHKSSLRGHGKHNRKRWLHELLIRTIMMDQWRLAQLSTYTVKRFPVFLPGCH